MLLLLLLFYRPSRPQPSRFAPSRGFVSACAELAAALASWGDGVHCLQYLYLMHLNRT